jgi:light-regulated signal transduction histidine kinase (bacteriophytochrome)
VLADLEARVSELDASVEVGALPLIDADPTQMRQLMQNLARQRTQVSSRGCAAGGAH